MKEIEDMYADQATLNPLDNNDQRQSIFKKPDIGIELPGRISDGTLRCTERRVNLKTCKNLFHWVKPINRMQSYRFEVAKQRFFLEHFMEGVSSLDSRPYVFIHDLIKDYYEYCSLLKCTAVATMAGKFAAQSQDERILIVSKSKDTLAHMHRYIPHHFKVRTVLAYNHLTSKSASHKVKCFNERKSNNILLAPHTMFLRRDIDLKNVTRVFFLDLSMDINENFSVLRSCFDANIDVLYSRNCITLNDPVENKLASRLYSQMINQIRSLGIETTAQRSLYYANQFQTE